MSRILHVKPLVKIIPAILLLLFLFPGCKKNDGSPFGFAGNTDLSTKVKSSVSGFVTDENELAVRQATVQFGTLSTTTDKYGYFEIKNAEVVKNAAVVTINVPGYFKSIKTCITDEGKSTFFRIKLIKKVFAGNISSASGGNVILSNGLSIAIPANAVVHASSNAAYTGNVNITAHWLNPTSTDLPNTMPGDLRGINTAGNLQLLTTYGMAAVELTGSSGELLQIAPGKKATLTFPIPSSISANAPASIPLWYFDEAKGLWKEEGLATKSGNNYVGEVSHFSFWNVDVPANFVQFSCTVVSTTGQPIPNAFVKISLVNDPANWRHGYTDINGYVSGPVPANAQLLMEIFSNSSCTTAGYSQAFTTTTGNIYLGNISIPGSTVANISGSVTNCAGNPVTNGNLYVQFGNVFKRYPLSGTGAYNYNLLLCGSSNSSITVFAEDLTTLTQSIPVSYPIAPGNNSLAVIQACGGNTQQFISFTYNGTPYSFSYPADTINHTMANNGPIFYDFATGYKTGSGFSAYVSYLHETILPGNSKQLYHFYSDVLGEPVSMINPPIMINFTEYAAIGQYISGNFTGSFKGNTSNTVYNVVLNFRVKRRF